MLNEEKGNMEKSFHLPDTLFKSRFCYFGCIGIARLSPGLNTN